MFSIVLALGSDGLHFLLATLWRFDFVGLSPLINGLAQTVVSYLRAVRRLWQWYAEGDVVVFNAFKILSRRTELLDALERKSNLSESFIARCQLDAGYM